MPHPLLVFASLSVALGIASALVVAGDLLLGHRQPMWIMNVVWAVTCLWSGPLGLWAYWRFGRVRARGASRGAKPRGRGRGEARPSLVAVAKGTTHCGSGCAIGDVAAELLFLAVPIVVFGRHLFGVWIYDYVLAFLVGIAFQYFTIKPMRNASPGEALVAALKADALSLTAWQVGMYGWMAIATFAIFHHELRATSVVFWFMMQIGMLLGFVTSYPVNWWLLRAGLKEAM